ncbi:MAG: DnaJ domain-containing protein [Pseudomonadota bacterium]
MKLDSKYFDSIRVKPDEDRLLRTKHVTCDWPGCDKPGQHKAPRGRDQEGEYYTFCVDHVRQYNKSYNYFTGMKDDEVAAFQKDARNGHRPTWKMGENAAATSKIKRDKSGSAGGFKPGMGRSDPFGLFGDEAPENPGRRRPVRNAERKALNALGLDETATPKEIKTKYKSLVKKHHPDANGGSRDSEDRFREIVQAYDYLRSSKLC